MLLLDDFLQQVISETLYGLPAGLFLPPLIKLIRSREALRATKDGKHSRTTNHPFHECYFE
ncbi:hypothetical protein ACH42_01820 [Endozoicomonas sp. (ex Bugula neritina AB1)]|nr:hypothetical protein ACH42_01820 [Endozoicomonas sp. (ex Bugula neritina AB1)]